jgi:hypothetical protein
VISKRCVLNYDISAFSTFNNVQTISQSSFLCNLQHDCTIPHAWQSDLESLSRLRWLGPFTWLWQWSDGITSTTLYNNYSHQILKSLKFFNIIFMYIHIIIYYLYKQTYTKKYIKSTHGCVY